MARVYYCCNIHLMETPPPSSRDNLIVACFMATMVVFVVLWVWQRH